MSEKQVKQKAAVGYVNRDGKLPAAATCAYFQKPVSKTVGSEVVSHTGMRPGVSVGVLLAVNALMLSMPEHALFDALPHH